MNSHNNNQKSQNFKKNYINNNEQYTDEDKSQQKRNMFENQKHQNRDFNNSFANQREQEEIFVQKPKSYQMKNYNEDKPQQQYLQKPQQHQNKMYSQKSQQKDRDFNQNSNKNQQNKDEKQNNQKGNSNQKISKNERKKQFAERNERKGIDKQYEHVLWRCRTCNQKNKWYNYKKCQYCAEYKFRTYNRMNKEVGKNDYDYLFFVDFECNNTDADGFEIIEFPLHVVDAHTFEIIETFQSYVRPTSAVTPFITELTQIEDSQVRKAPLLKDVLVNVQIFLEKYLEVGLERCVIVYDCDSDSDFLSDETKKKGIDVPPIFQRFICLKSVFPPFINNPPKCPASLSKMLGILKMEFQGQQHCGADDSRNQALVTIELLKRGYLFSKLMEIPLGKPSILISDEVKKQKCQEYLEEYELKKEEYEESYEKQGQLFSKFGKKFNNLKDKN